MKKEKFGIFQYNFKRLLALKGWDLADCAAETGIALGSLKKYSAGYREPDTEFRKILEDTFKVETFEFYRPISGDLPTPPQSISELTGADIKALVLEALEEAPKQSQLTDGDIEVLACAHKIPADILRMLSTQSSVYFNSLRRELQLKTLVKPTPKKSRNSAN